MAEAATAKGREGLPRRLGAAFFLMGFVATGAQVLLLRRMLSVLYGNEMIVGGALAIWMAGTGIGSLAAGGRISGASAKQALAAVSLVSVALVPLTTLATYGVRAFQGVPAGQALSPGSSVLISAVLLLPLTAALGAMFVFFSVVAPRGGEERIGVVYLLEAAGAAAGGMASGVAASFGAPPFAWSFALGAGFVAILHLSAPRGRLWRPLGWTLLALTGILTWGPGAALPQTAESIFWPGQTVLASVESRYASLVVSESEGQRTLHVDALPDLVYPDYRTAEMTIHTALLQHPSPRRVLLIGGGISQAAQEAFKHGIERIDYVQIDPAIHELEREYLSGRVAHSTAPLDDPRVSVYGVDGRLFVNEARDGNYDVVIVDVADPATVLMNRFYTRDFFERVKDALGPEGVLAFTCGEMENYVSGRLARLLASVSLALRASFPDYRMLPLGEIHFVASKSQSYLSADGKELEERLEERGIETSFMRDYYLGYDLSAERVDNLTAAVSAALAAGGVRVNSDRAPVAHHYYLAYWYNLLGSKLSPVLELSLRRGFPLLVPAAAVLAFAATWAAGRRRAGGASAAAVLVMGFCTISTQVVILVALQTYRGQLYHSVGMVVAAFMVGLALGTAWARRRGGGRSPAWPQAVLAWYCLAVGAAVLLPVGLAPAGAMTPLAIVAGLGGGLLGGAVFQRAAYSGRDEGGRTDGARAGTLNACDHAGAAIGALAAASVLIPALGLPGTAALAAAAAGGSAAGLVLGRR
jgi:spermidine synthase